MPTFYFTSPAPGKRPNPCRRFVHTKESLVKLFIHPSTFFYPFFFVFFGLGYVYLAVSCPSVVLCVIKICTQRVDINRYFFFLVYFYNIVQI